MTTSRTPLLAVLLSLAACGGGKASPAAPTERPPGKEVPPGTSGLPGLDWGAGPDAVRAWFPDAEDSGDTLAWEGDVEGVPARMVFELAGGGLRQVEVYYLRRFDSMEACGDTLHAIRAAFDRRLGEGPEENLAVFWETETTSAVLSCNPDEAGDSATLSQTYQPRQAE